MSETTYTIKIKKEYAAAIIEDLKQVDAIEIVQEPISQWQKQESLKRLAAMKDNPSSVIDEDVFFKSLEDGESKKI